MWNASSDTIRARETVEIVGASLDLAIKTDPRLRKVNFGDESPGEPLLTELSRIRRALSGAAPAAEPGAKVARGPVAQWIEQRFSKPRFRRVFVAWAPTC